MKTTISQEGINVLKKIIGKKLKSITAENWNEFNRSYGNIKIKLEDECIMIENDYRNIPYFDDMEELSGYGILQLNSCRDFQPSVMPDKLLTVDINKEIKSIKIVQDSINIQYHDSDRTNTYTIDQAIIFGFENDKWLISQISLFTPMSKMIFAHIIDDEIKSINEVTEEWKDEPDEGNERYEVSVEREILNL